MSSSMQPELHSPDPAPSGATTDPGLRERHGDLVAGGVFVVLGVAFAVAAHGYGLGTWDEMGAGMFPFLLGLALAALGTAIALGALRPGGETTAGLSRVPWRGLICVTGAIVAFAYAVPTLGLIPATVITVLVTCLASPTTTVVKALAATAGITAGCYLIFVVALQLRLPLFGS